MSEVRVGFHARRIPVLDIALWDTVGTVGVAYLASKYKVFGVDSFAKQLAIWFGLGFLAHLAFGVDTQAVVFVKRRPWWHRSWWWGGSHYASGDVLRTVEPAGGIRPHPEWLSKGPMNPSNSAPPLPPPPPPGGAPCVGCGGASL